MLTLTTGLRECRLAIAPVPSSILPSLEGSAQSTLGSGGVLLHRYKHYLDFFTVDLDLLSYFKFLTGEKGLHCLQLHVEVAHPRDPCSEPLQDRAGISEVCNSICS